MTTSKTHKQYAQPPTVGILRRIMELWRIYRYVKFVNKVIKKDREFALESFCYLRFWQVKHRAFILRFTQQYVIDINNFAIQRGYLSAYSRDGRNLKVTEAGRDLIEMHGIGFIVVACKKYSSVLSLLAVLAAIASVIISLNK